MADDDNDRDFGGWLWGLATLILGLIVAFGAWAIRDDVSGNPAAPADAVTEVPAEEANADDAAGDGADAAADAAGDATADAGDAADGAGDAAADAATDATDGAAADGDGASADGASAEAPPACKLRVGQTTLTLSAETAAALDQAGIAVSIISPAERAREAIRFPIVSSSRVDCDSLTGRVGHRGGVRFTAGESVAELRRFRLDTATGELIAFPKSTGNDGIAALTLDIAAAERAETPTSIELSSVPVTLTAAGATALNDGLGADAFAADAQLGLATFTAEKG